METKTYRSNVFGRLKVKGQILNYDDKIELTDEEVNNPEITKLIITKQLV